MNSHRVYLVGYSTIRFSRLFITLFNIKIYGPPEARFNKKKRRPEDLLII